VPILVKQVAEVKMGPGVLRGDASVNAQPAVILSIQKQPGANTVELSRKVDQALAELQRTLPADVKINNEVFGRNASSRHPSTTSRRFCATGPSSSPSSCSVPAQLPHHGDLADRHPALLSSSPGWC
jgi:hypothetical protein